MRADDLSASAGSTMGPSRLISQPRCPRLVDASGFHVAGSSDQPCSAVSNMDLWNLVVRALRD